MFVLARQWLIVALVGLGLVLNAVHASALPPSLSSPMAHMDMSLESCHGGESAVIASDQSEPSTMPCCQKDCSHCFLSFGLIATPLLLADPQVSSFTSSWLATAPISYRESPYKPPIVI